MVAVLLVRILFLLGWWIMQWTQGWQWSDPSPTE